jgi:hypothetical protein
MWLSRLAALFSFSLHREQNNTDWPRIVKNIILDRQNVKRKLAGRLYEVS